MKHYLLERSML